MPRVSQTLATRSGVGTIREAFAQSAVTATTFIWTGPGDLLMMKGGIMLETIVRDQQWFIKMAKLLISTMQAACCMEVGFLIWTFITKVLLEQRTRRAGCTSMSRARLYIRVVSRQLNLSTMAKPECKVGMAHGKSSMKWPRLYFKFMPLKGQMYLEKSLQIWLAFGKRKPYVPLWSWACRSASVRGRWLLEKFILAFSF